MGFWANLVKTKKQRIAEHKKQRFDECKKQLNFEKIRQAHQNRKKLKEKENAIPLIKANNALRQTLKGFEDKRNELAQQWQQAYINFSWWNKFKHDEKLDLSDLDKQIITLRVALANFEKNHISDVHKLNIHFVELERLSRQRIEIAYKKALQELKKDTIKEPNNNLLAAGWLATLSIPISIWNDVNSADQVYVALRSVNGNFEGLSNSEIWWETLWMSPDSYAGLVGLTKGAYFESLVSQDTGGAPHEHFNHPDTDIVINGVEVQLKATDSISYINSVDQDIPVIATSEVALNTSATDSGFSNENITNTVEQALGGSVIDAKDTAVDAILTGVGSLGVFATMRGINHASARYETGVDGVESIFEGAGVAIEGTAKGLVDAGEMVYNVAMSRPSRFIGRALKKGFITLDNKMMEAGNNTKERKQ
jgi:hypothetical protein